VAERHGALAFLLRFATGYMLLFALYGMVPNEVLREAVFHHGLAVPGARVIDVISPAAEVRAAANVIASHRATLEIVRGCEGAGTFFLLAAAIVALGGERRRVAVGLALGLALVYALNLARIVALFFVVAHRHAWFEFVHVYAAPVAVIALLAAFFWWWAQRPPTGVVRAAG
jgi:exosortase family protein XrtM